MKQFAVEIDDIYLVNAYLAFLHDHGFHFVTGPQKNYLVPHENKKVVFLKNLPPNYPSLSLTDKWELACKFIEQPEVYDINVGDTVKFKDDGTVYILTDLKYNKDDGWCYWAGDVGAFFLGEEACVEKVVELDYATEYVYSLKRDNVDKKTVKKIIKMLKELC